MTVTISQEKNNKTTTTVNRKSNEKNSPVSSSGEGVKLKNGGGRDGLPPYRLARVVQMEFFLMLL